jgi:hypothetical protein
MALEDSKLVRKSLQILSVANIVGSAADPVICLAYPDPDSTFQFDMDPIRFPIWIRVLLEQSSQAQFYIATVLHCYYWSYVFV